MPAPLSILIPTLDAADDLPACLNALMPGLETGLIRDVVLADGGSRDATRQIGDDAGCTVIDAPRGRARQMNAAAETARGTWYLFLHADTVLSLDWAERVLEHMAAHPSQAAVFTLAFRSDAPEARWLAARANRRTRWLALPYGDQGLLISASLFQAMGGFENVDLMEDVIMARRLGRQRLRLLSAVARTSAAKYERDGWRRRAYGNAWRLVRFLAGTRPDVLARTYR